MKAMILAAGRGERMRPLTDATPKPLLEAGGKTLLEYHLTALATAGVVDIVINLAWLGEQIEAYAGDGGRFGVQIRYSREPEGALETGGGILQALGILGNAPFWLVNGDVFCEYPFEIRGLPGGDQGHLVMVPNPDHHPRGDFLLADGRIATGADGLATYSGIAVLDPGLFVGCHPGRFSLAPLLTSAADAGRLSGELFKGRWTDAGTPERLRELDTLLSDRSP